VLEHHEVVDVQTLEAMYKEIGTPLTGGLSGYETSAARADGDAVLTEIAHEPAAGPQLTGPYHIFLTGKPRIIVKDAFDGAIRRLATANGYGGYFWIEMRCARSAKFALSTTDAVRGCGAEWIYWPTARS
jgi:hypothetical protein